MDATTLTTKATMVWTMLSVILMKFSSADLMLTCPELTFGSWLPSQLLKSRPEMPWKRDLILLFLTSSSRRAVSIVLHLPDQMRFKNFHLLTWTVRKCLATWKAILDLPSDRWVYSLSICEMNVIIAIESDRLWPWWELTHLVQIIQINLDMKDLSSIIKRLCLTTNITKTW